MKRISAGDKRTSFVGAHYFYEDVSGRRPSDDRHELLDTTNEYYVLRHRPVEPGTVEFAQYETWIDRETYLPMKIEYTNPAGSVYRRVDLPPVRRRISSQARWLSQSSPSGAGPESRSTSVSRSTT